MPTKILVVYDSFFGNTEKIAQAIGRFLGSRGSVEMLRIGDMKPEKLIGSGLLIVGSPTRRFKPAKPIVAFLDKLPSNSLKGIGVAAFDTRISPADKKSRLYKIVAKVFGFAAQPIASRLMNKGGHLVLPPEGFIVNGSEGPLKDGELERAAKWGESVLGAR